MKLGKMTVGRMTVGAGRGTAAVLAAVEGLEDRRLMSAAPSAFRSVDGSGNNLANSSWGAVGTPQLRLTAAAYGDGKSTPAGASRPSARAVSNAVAAHPSGTIKNERTLSAFAYAWGQFIDHDLDLTNSAAPAEAFAIAVPTDDPYFDPGSTGTKTIPLTRSQYTVDAKGVRQQTNSITAYIDGSMVYGSDKATADSLRTFTGGKLKTSEGNLLPIDAGFMFAGDVRATENPGLLALQVAFMREHNRLAAEIGAGKRDLTDEQIYQQARRLVVGEIQSITYNEYLPALLGEGAIRDYKGYDPKANAQVSLEFSTAAYRFGHSMLEDDIEFLDDDGEEVREPVGLADAFFDQSIIQETGPGPILKYLASANAEEVDTKVVDSLRNFLFGPPGAGGLDLAALNIQRGRDHGLGDYNSVRGSLGLPKVKSFADITPDAAVQEALKATYGTVNNIDLWVGGLAEAHLKGSSFGPTFQRILAEQFTRTRDGDRFFYERDLNGKDLKFADNTSLADVIARNTTISNLQENVFFFEVKVAGRLFADGNGDGKMQPPEKGIEGRRVTLKDEAGAVVATTRSGKNGEYVFSNLELGTYTVTTDLLKTTTAATVAVTATKATVIAGVNFGAKPVQLPPPPPPGPGVTPPPPPPGSTPPPVARDKVQGPATGLVRNPPRVFA